MRTISPFLLAALAVAAPSAAQTPGEVAIGSGEEVLVRAGDDGALTIERRSRAAPMTDFDRRTLRKLAAVEVPPGTVAPGLPMQDKAARDTPIAAGKLRITLRDVAARTPHDTLLVIENGYGDGVRYRAVMRRGERAEPTDVCLVLPGKRAYEYWPYPIERLDLSAFRLVPWKPEDGLPCA